MAINPINPMADLFAPRKALTDHLQKLVEQGVIRGVAQAQDFSEVMDGVTPANHGFVYVTYDKSKNTTTQGIHSIKSTEVYTLILAWRNNRSELSNDGHGMDVAGVTKSLIEFHVHGWTIDNQYRSATTGKPFIISESSPEAFYRAGGWGFYPMSFDIEVTRVRPKPNTNPKPLT